MEGKDRSVVTNRAPRPIAESVVTETAEKTPRYAWVIWLVTFLISFAAPMAQFKIVSIPLYFIYVPGVSPAGCFGLDASGFGMLMTMVSLIGIVLAFPAAFICRKLGLRNTIALSAVGVIVGGLIEIAGGNNVATMMVGRFLEGTGIGLAGVSAPTLITLWFPDKTRGFALGLWCCWVPLSITLDSMICPPLAAAIGWQGVFGVVVAFAVVALILFWVFYKVPEGEGANYNVEGTFSECLGLLKNPQIWLLGLVFLVFIIGQTGIVNTYLPTFLQSAQPVGWGWSEALAGTGLAIVTGISIVANPLGGSVTARLPHRLKRIVPVAVAISYLICFYLLFQNGNETLTWVGIVLMGICGGFGGGGLRPLAPAIMNKSAMAATMGMAVMQFAQCLGNCFSPIYGGLIDGGATYWDACLYTIIPLSVIMLVAAFFIRPGKNSPVRDK
ncbi:MAG: MFS transporter [Eggerthellaceae bacterium]|nr:MFS transporter [Eggerthellaceae bacterium]